MTNYFSHDYDAQADIKIQSLIMKMGYEALGRYWCIVEMLYKQSGRIELSQCDSIAFALRTDSDNIKQIISLVFSTDDKYFWSETILKRMKMQKEKSTKAQKSAQKRWGNEAKSSNATTDANAMRTHSDGNAIKEKKIKEKENKSISKPSAHIEYLIHIPLDDLMEFTKVFEVTVSQINTKAKSVYDSLISRGKTNTYKDYKALMRNILRRDFGERKIQPKPVEAEFMPQTPEEKERAERVKDEIRTHVLPRTRMEGGGM